MSLKKHLRRSCIAFIIFLLMYFQVDAQVVIPNGDLTGTATNTYNGTPPPGWTSTYQSPDTWDTNTNINGFSAPPSPNGGTFVRTNGLGPEAMQTTVTGMTVGVPVTIDFWYAESCMSLSPMTPFGGYILNLFGIAQTTPTTPCGTPAVWVPYSFTWTPTATSSILNVRTISTSGHTHTIIDGLQVGVVLPIESLQFGLQLNRDRTVSLSWSTGRETDSDFFAVERSQDGAVWEEIGRTSAAGNSAETQFYSFLDKAPLYDKSYYRLRQVDFDGRGHFSDTEIADFDQPVEGKVLAFPNPTKGECMLVANENEFGSLAIFDVLGNDVTKNVVLTEISPVQIKVDMSTLNPGVYIVKSSNTITKISKR